MPQPAEKVFNFLADFSNFPTLLPTDRVNIKETSSNHIVFEIKGMATIGLKIANKNPFTNIEVEPSGKSPFPFTMTILVDENSPNQTSAHLVFNAEVNSFLKMMVETPLTNFFNSLADKLQAQFTTEI